MLEKALHNTVPSCFVNTYKQIFPKSSRAFYVQVPHKTRQMCFFIYYMMQVLLSGDNVCSPQRCASTAARHETLLRLPACSRWLIPAEHLCGSTLEKIQFPHSPERPQEHPLQWGLCWQYVRQRGQSSTWFTGLCLSRAKVDATLRPTEDPHGRGGWERGPSEPPSHSLCPHPWRQGPSWWAGDSESPLIFLACCPPTISAPQRLLSSSCACKSWPSPPASPEYLDNGLEYRIISLRQHLHQGCNLWLSWRGILSSILGSLLLHNSDDGRLENAGRAQGVNLKHAEGNLSLPKPHPERSHTGWHSSLQGQVGPCTACAVLQGTSKHGADSVWAQRRGEFAPSRKHFYTPLAKL